MDSTLSPDDRSLVEELRRQIARHQAKAEGVSEALQAYLSSKYQLTQGDRIDLDGHILRAAPPPDGSA